jgi:hypothetical protein
MSVLPPIELATLRKIEPTDVHLLWVNDWYDGPLEAVVEHEGARCLLVLHDERALHVAGEPYRWLLVRLTPEQQADEERWHTLFAQHVGEHWCMHKEPHPKVPGPRDPELFFRPMRARPPRDLAKSDVLGWLDQIPPG